MTKSTAAVKRDHSAERRNMRAVANNVILHLHPTRVPVPALRLSYTWGLGGIATTLVAALIVSGILLMFRYEPGVDSAWQSIVRLETEVWFGALIRAIHHWAGNGLVVVAFLHLLRVFFTGGYQKGRTLNWMLGVGLLLLVLAFNFTGYLLPWDQLAYWAVTVGTSLLGFVPLVGRGLSRALLGGLEVGQATLTNFYAVHVAVLPMILLAAMTWHFWRIRKDGGISQPSAEKKQRVTKLTTLPHLVWRELAAAVVVITALVLWSMAIAAPLEAQADPNHPLNPARAAWYFMGVQELLLHMQAQAAMALAAIVLVALVLLPLWDRQSQHIGIYFRSAVGRERALAGALLALLLVPLLVVADEWWIDLPRWLGSLPLWLSDGLLPLLLTLGGVVGIYLLMRWVPGFGRIVPTHSEAVVGLFTFVMTSLLVLTLIGVFFRGENMALVSPF